GDADLGAAGRASGLRARARLRRHPRDAAPPGRIRGRRGRAGCRAPRASAGAGGRRSGRSAGRELRRRRGTGGRRSLRRSCTQGDPGRARWLGVDHQPALTVEHQWDDLLLAEELAHVTRVPLREARTSPLPEDLHPELRAALARQGIEQLYEHQAEAWASAARGEHLIVTTGTASGKTLAFNLPVLNALAAEPKSRALYLYPTKALAQDQARALGELEVARVRAAIYDGDTPSERRPQIRRFANLVLT